MVGDLDVLGDEFLEERHGGDQDVRRLAAKIFCQVVFQFHQVFLCVKTFGEGLEIFCGPLYDGAIVRGVVFDEGVAFWLDGKECFLQVWRLELGDEMPCQGSIEVVEMGHELCVGHIPEFIAVGGCCIEFFDDGSLQDALCDQCGFVEVPVLVEIGIVFLELLDVFQVFCVDCQSLWRHGGVELEFFDIGRSVEADMECVPHEVIQFVRTEVSVRDPDSKRVVFLEHVDEVIGIELALFDGVRHELDAFDADVMVVVVEDRFDLMREGAVADIMEQGECLEQFIIVVVEILDAADSLHQRQDADGVLESGMDRAREHDVVDAQLLAFAEFLETWMVHDGQELLDIDWWCCRDADGFHDGRRGMGCTVACVEKALATGIARALEIR